MLVARESAFSRRRRCNLKTQVSVVQPDTLVIVTDSKMNLCRVNTVVLLHVLKASEAVATACSNSSLVVSGTRVRSVCVDYYDVILGQNK
jgi:hypothetical protein